MPATLEKNIPLIQGMQREHYPEAASQDFPVDFPVKWSSGAIVELVDPSVDANITTSDTGLVGIARRAASGTTGTKIPVDTLKIGGRNEIWLPLYAATASNATYANTVLGQTYVLRMQDGKLCVNRDTTTNGVATVLAFDGSPTDEKYTMVKVKIVDTILL